MKSKVKTRIAISMAIAIQLVSAYFILWFAAFIIFEFDHRLPRVMLMPMSVPAYIFDSAFGPVTGDPFGDAGIKMWARVLFIHLFLSVILSIPIYAVLTIIAKAFSRSSHPG